MFSCTYIICMCICVILCVVVVYCSHSYTSFFSDVNRYVWPLYGWCIPAPTFESCKSSEPFQVGGTFQIQKIRGMQANGQDVRYTQRKMVLIRRLKPINCRCWGILRNQELLLTLLVYLDHIWLEYRRYRCWMQLVDHYQLYQIKHLRGDLPHQIWVVYAERALQLISIKQYCILVNNKDSIRMLTTVKNTRLVQWRFM